MHLSLFDLSMENVMALFYIWANIVSFIVVLILLIKSMNNMQTRTRIFKLILISLMIYFIGDSIWALAYFEIVPHSSIMIRVSRMIYYSDSCYLALAWFSYVAVVVDSRIVKNRRRNLLFLPICLSAIATIFICAFLNPAEKSIKGYLTVLALVLVPFVFIISSGVLALKKRLNTNDDSLKKVYNTMALWPSVIVLVSIFQVFFAELPIFCFGAIIVTVSLYIYNQESLIFTDALTGINNRNMLNKYSQDIALKECFVLMIDVDKFKHINDEYGHLEGDRALKYIANVLKEVCGSENYFLARYGGDEFVLVSSDANEEKLSLVENRINEKMQSTKDDLGYEITVSIGHFKKKSNEDFSKAIAKSDYELYEKKKIVHRK